jgi:superfamily II DNA or RNA helicase
MLSRESRSAIESAAPAKEIPFWFISEVRSPIATSDDIARQIGELRRRLIALDTERSEITEQLQALERAFAVHSVAPDATGAASINMASPTAAKINLFRSLFRGREDVFPRRWENPRTGKAGYAPACRNEWVRGVCGKPQVKCGECPNQAFVPLGEEVIRWHLQGRMPSGASGDFTAGVYPMLADETCWFLVADFDKKSWMRDVGAFRDTARARGVPVAIERSRSGNGAHAWIFFAECIPAAEARRLGALLVTATMERCPDIGFDSYDRLFPSQDTMPAGGFGNLIALPLQNRPRENGNSVFVDDNFRPHDDQWAFLSTIRRLSRDEVSTLVREAAAAGQILGVPLPMTEDDAEPWAAPPSRRKIGPVISGELPKSVEIVLGNQIYIDRLKLQPALVNRLERLAAFQNPEFYAAQAMRLPTFGKPRIISCAELFLRHLALPRGCNEDVLSLLNDLGIAVEIRDERQSGAPLGVRFLGTLTPEQEAATVDLLRHDTGVLAATTGFGKTVVAAKLIAARARNALVLVHRRQLLDQWVARLGAFLDLAPDQIGVIHGAKKRVTGVVDIALLQSLVRRGVVSDLVANYGHVVVDECHHVSAVGFEAIARAAKARYVLGLSATVTRKDGHHPIIFMQCGPVRHRVDARKQAAARPFDHKVIFRRTEFRRAQNSSDDKPAIQDLYARLVEDPTRNELIFDDILKALEAGRSPVVITERKDHVTWFADRLSKFAKNVIVLQGGMGARQSRAVAESLAAISDNEERVLVATGRYLGEGFDDARLDTLFLTLPISWRGTLAQYAGRLHRLHTTKREVIIYDYVDENEPMLVKMAAKREAGYRTLGYRVVGETGFGLRELPEGNGPQYSFSSTAGS